MSNYNIGAGQAYASPLTISGLKLNRDYQPTTERDSITMLETKKKPGFFKRWLYKLSEEAWNYKNQEREEQEQMKVKMAVSRLAVDSEPSLNRDKAIRFNVYIANGGRVVEVSRYDRKSDRNIDGLYVIGNDQDFGREIDKILTMEHLK